MTVYGRATEALLKNGNIINGNCETQPPTTIFSARLHGLAEWCLV
jgi:hypothetical protein